MARATPRSALWAVSHVQKQVADHVHLVLGFSVGRAGQESLETHVLNKSPSG